MEFMKIKFVIVGVLTALLPNVCAYAGESQASSAASTMSQSSAGNQQSSQATTKPSTSATTSTSSGATTSSTSQSTTQNPNSRGTVVQQHATTTKTTSAEPKLYRARAASKVKYYTPGYRKPATKVKTSSTTHWQTKTYR
jgi:peptidoglycan DL-endopeptidase CwlO